MLRKRSADYTDLRRLKKTGYELPQYDLPDLRGPARAGSSTGADLRRLKKAVYELNEFKRGQREQWVYRQKHLF